MTFFHQYLECHSFFELGLYLETFEEFFLKTLDETVIDKWALGGVC